MAWADFEADYRITSPAEIVTFARIIWGTWTIGVCGALFVGSHT